MIAIIVQNECALPSENQAFH